MSTLESSTVSDAAHGPPLAPERRWAREAAGEHYAERRFRNRRAASRDPRHIVALLERHLDAPVGAPVLDAPAGAGRLREDLEDAGLAWHGLDVSAPMLAAARARGARRVVRGNVLALPFPERAFAAVVACRFLHHLADEARFRAAVAELVRVADRVIVVTFWNSAVLSELWPRRRRPRGRVTRPLAEVRAAFAAAGAQVVEVRHSWRFLSRQTYVAAVRADAQR